MRFKRIADEPKTFVVVFDTGEEIIAGLKKLGREQHLAGSSFKAIGALSRTTFGFLNWKTKKDEIVGDLNEQVELLSLIGDIALKDGEPEVHAHIVVGRRDGTAHGGHLLKAHVRPTCELVLTENPAHLQKRIDPQSGLALIRF
jgi:predicted DNA-binding protein with PD1-like motif